VKNSKKLVFGDRNLPGSLKNNRIKIKFKKPEKI
jgi:hypothetical protein